MSQKSLSRMGSHQLVTLGAMALAARLFDNRSEDGYRFAASVRDAHFLASGHLHLWREYPQLGTEDVRRITRLLLHRPGRLAILVAFRNAVTDLLTSSARPDGFALLGSDRFLVTEETRLELGMLVDALHTVGLDALAQVDVGVRHHRHQDGQALGRMAAAIYRTAQLRLARGHLLRPALTQFERGPQGFEPHTHPVDTEERPPMTEIAEYTARRVA